MPDVLAPVGPVSPSDAQGELGLVTANLDALLAAFPPASTANAEFWGAQFDHGLAWVHFPTGRGGLGVSASHQAEVDRRILDAGGSVANREINVVGIGMAAATLLGHASDEAQDRLLRPLFTTEEIWCQLFSEPGAGSDLAGLATSATALEGSWLVNGQKVWTTLAHRARWALLLTRTDPDVPKHKGLTYFYLDMTSPGVDVRPLYELTGEAEFNEVYLDDVRVPDEMRLGEVGGGWAVTMTTLMTERVMASGAVGERGSGPIEMAVQQWLKCSDRGQRRDELVRNWIDAEVLRLTQLRANEARDHGAPGPEGSVAKLMWAELNQQITSFTLDLLGPEAMEYPGGYEFSRPEASQVRTEHVHKAFLRARANSIEGGTSEIMRNILAERVLGLPPDHGNDRTVAWRDISRS